MLADMDDQLDLLDWLKYASYRANRGYGATMAALVAVGFDPRFESIYAAEMAGAA